MLNLFFLFIPSLIVIVLGYSLVLRPILSTNPKYAAFFAKANGFWATVWAYSGKSITIVWGKILGGIGLTLELLDPVANAVGDPGFKDQVTGMLQTNPKVLGFVLMGISIVTVVARLRGILKST